MGAGTGTVLGGVVVAGTVVVGVVATVVVVIVGAEVDAPLLVEVLLLLHAVISTPTAAIISLNGKTFLMRES